MLLQTKKLIDNLITQTEKWNGKKNRKDISTTHVFLDIPVIKPAALALARGHNMTPVFETGRMYNKEMPAINIRCQYKS